MLRRRGIFATMLAGVKFSGESKLFAHAWIDTDVKSKSSENSSFAIVMRIGIES
jgi:hypothetical protein